jgi:hypothetical protein
MDKGKQIECPTCKKLANFRLISPNKPIAGTDVFGGHCQHCGVLIEFHAGVVTGNITADAKDAIRKG